MGDITKNFNRSEFACKCGCGYDDVDIELVFRLQALRDRIGRPIKINSACRCPKHNKRVGGVGDSYHTKGKAADIVVAGMPVAELHNQVVQSGLFKGIGYYPRKQFVHVDVRPQAARWTA